MKLYLFVFVFFFVFVLNLSNGSDNLVYQSFNITGIKCLENGETIQIDQCTNLCQVPQDIHYLQDNVYEINIYEGQDCKRSVDRQIFSCPVTQIGGDVIRCANVTQNENFNSFNVEIEECSSSVNLNSCSQMCGVIVKIVKNSNILFGYTINFFEDNECNNPSAINNSTFKCLPNNQSLPVNINGSSINLSCNSSYNSSSSQSSFSQSSSHSSSSVNSSSSLESSSNTTSFSNGDSSSNSINSSSKLKISFLLIISSILIYI